MKMQPETKYLGVNQSINQHIYLVCLSIYLTMGTTKKQWAGERITIGVITCLEYNSTFHLSNRRS